ncbi:DUF6928 family protein [Dactylosporangium cerinum]|uniref:DUF6928 family protein n=1 Tax=Dactylosporangium cerinum TaxID=1434730 RepID=A0ABV9W6A6_9ACTN
MGAKTAMLVYADGAGVIPVLRGTTSTDAGEAAALLRRLWPERDVEPDGEEPWALFEAVYPPEDTTCALAVPGLAIVCDQRIALDRPSQLPARLVAAEGGRRVILHAMHSVVDWTAFAVWEDGRLIRSLSVAPDFGILEDLGERLPFESTYWNGDHAVDGYPLPFHPLALGERAMGELLGFYAEGLASDDEAPAERVDAEAVELHGFLMRER